MTTSAVRPPAPPADLDAALARVRERGGRVTRAKRAIATLLFDAPTALTAEEITGRSGLEQSVVYRCLAQFDDIATVQLQLSQESVKSVLRMASACRVRPSRQIAQPQHRPLIIRHGSVQAW